MDVSMGLNPLGAVGGVIGNIIGSNTQKKANETNLRIAKENRDWQTSERVAQNEWNLDQWNRQNEYNSTKSQVQRLKEGGINPYMALSGSAGGSATGNTSPLTSASPASAPNMPNIQAFKPDIDPIASSLDTMFIRSSQVKKTLSETKGIDITNAYLPEQYQQSIYKLKTENEWLPKLFKDQHYSNEQQQYMQDMLNEKQMLTLGSDVEQTKFQTNIMKVQLVSQNLDNATKQTMLQWMPAEKCANYLMLLQNLYNLEKQGRLTEMQMQALGVGMLESYARIGNINEDTKLKGAQIGNVNSDTFTKQIDNKKLVATYRSCVSAIEMQNLCTSMTASNEREYQGALKYHPWIRNRINNARAAGDWFRALNPFQGIFKSK